MSFGLTFNYLYRKFLLEIYEDMYLCIHLNLWFSVDLSI